MGQYIEETEKFYAGQRTGLEHVQAEPTMQTPKPLWDIPSTAVLIPTETDIPTAPSEDEELANSSGEPTQSEGEPPPTAPPTLPLQPTVKMTRSGRIIKPPLKLNI